MEIVNFGGAFSCHLLPLFNGCFDFYLCKQFTNVEFASSKQFEFSSPGVSQVVEELDKILAFNNLLISLKNHPDVDRFACGVGPISLLGKLPNCLYLFCLFSSKL